MSEPAKSDMETLFPGRDVTINGATIRVVPLFFGQYPQAVKLIRPLLTVFRESGAFGVKPAKQPDGTDGFQLTMSDNWLASLPLLLEHGGEALMQFFAFAMSKPRVWLDTVPGDQGLALAHAILSENADFFVQKIMPLLAEFGLMKMVPTVKDGAESLPASASTDTPGATSS